MSSRNPTLRIWIITLSILSAMAATAAAAPSDQVIAKVNDVAITMQDLALEQAQVMTEMQRRNHPMGADRVDALKKELLETLIERELLYQKARERDLQIRNRWVERLLDELKEKIGGNNGYRSFLASVGLDEPGLKERMRRGLVVQRLLRRDVVRRIKVSEAEMQVFFRQHPEYFVRREQVRVRHILIAVDDPSDVEMRGRALLRIQAIQNMLSEGTAFAALALEHSDDPSKSRGGDLGYQTRDRLIPAFAQAAFSLQPGEVSNIVETHLGYHLIQMIDRLPASPMAYRNARDKIERTLRRNKEKKAADAYLARLRKTADIRRLVQFKQIVQ